MKVTRADLRNKFILFFIVFKHLRKLFASSASPEIIKKNQEFTRVQKKLTNGHLSHTLNRKLL
jgi:hypothetical protein